MASIDASDRQLLVEAVRRFVDREVIPTARELEHADQFPEALVARMRELGLFAATIPEPYGGLGLDFVTYAQLVVTGKLDSGEATDKGDKKYLKLREIVGHDPLPYGIEENRKTIEALEATAFKQGLTPRRMSMSELFADPRA